MKRFVATLLTIATLAGCSNQWREGEPEASPEEVASLLSEISGAQGATAGSGNMSSALQYQQEAVIYFNDAPRGNTLVPNVVSFPNFQWLTGREESWESFTEARVFFLDHLRDGGSDVGLIIGLNDGSGYSYYSFSGTGSVKGGTWEAELTGGNGGTIILRSYNFSDGVLDNVIQLKIYSDDGSGNLQYVGKIPTLYGFE